MSTALDVSAFVLGCIGGWWVGHHYGEKARRRIYYGGDQ